MPLILNIETSTPVCSVAISQNAEIIGILESSVDKSHASHLATFIQEILKENSIEKKDIDAVAVSQWTRLLYRFTDRCVNCEGGCICIKQTSDRSKYTASYGLWSDQKTSLPDPEISRR